MSTVRCEKCGMRKRYEENPRSWLARLWRWHTRWCPGWKAYMKSLPEDERQALLTHLDQLAR